MVRACALGCDLPRFFLLLVLLLVVLGVVVCLLLVVVEVVVFVIDVVHVVLQTNDGHTEIVNVASCHDAGSAAGFGLSRFGGGYVVQKCRPQRGHTQN